MAGTRWTWLPSLSVVAVTGRDARAFLQGQLTSDLLGLDRHAGMLAAACNRQGRVVALLRLARRGDQVLLLLHRSMAPLLVAHLARFVLRSEVAFAETGDSVAGLLDAPPSLQAAARSAGLLPLVAGRTRALMIGDRAVAANLLAGLPQAPAEDWETASIEDGEPEVYPETSGLWVPQMINLDLLSAVSFSKGCFLGQEIVARAQHLGRIRRRMLRYVSAADAELAPGRMLYGGSEPAAQVVRAAAAGDGAQCLAVVALEDCAELLGTAPGHREFVPADLPYAIPALAAAEESLPAD
ncbi:MAG: folate-binding protein YgfZ [Steroidobacteraceae bacterium]|nr:folate-binding protein YgfZ [Steroidobacteraceae bacterium]